MIHERRHDTAPAQAARYAVACDQLRSPTLRGEQTHRGSAGRSGRWFVIAGGFVVARAVIELAEPVYYDPETLLDYAAATLSSTAWLATAVALARWWPAMPAKQASLLLLVAAVGIAASAVGDFLEDVVDVALGEPLFTVGGVLSAVSILITGVVLLVLRGARWPGVLLLMFVTGSTFPDDGGEFLSGASLILLGYVIHRYQAAREFITASR